MLRLGDKNHQKFATGRHNDGIHTDHQETEILTMIAKLNKCSDHKRLLRAVGHMNLVDTLREDKVTKTISQGLSQFFLGCRFEVMMRFTTVVVHHRHTRPQYQHTAMFGEECLRRVLRAGPLDGGPLEPARFILLMVCGAPFVTSAEYLKNWCYLSDAMIALSFVASVAGRLPVQNWVATRHTELSTLLVSSLAGDEPEVSTSCVRDVMKYNIEHLETSIPDTALRPLTACCHAHPWMAAAMLAVGVQVRPCDIEYLRLRKDHAPASMLFAMEFVTQFGIVRLSAKNDEEEDEEEDEDEEEEEEESDEEEDTPRRRRRIIAPNPYVDDEASEDTLSTTRDEHRDHGRKRRRL